MSKKTTGRLTPNEERALSHGVNFIGMGITALLLLFALGEAIRASMVSAEYTDLLMGLIVAGFIWFGFLQLRAFKTQLDTDPLKESE